MKTTLSILALTATLAFAQGPLTPPGAPGATMKTLDEVEPRTPIHEADLPMTISGPGSYYLAGSISFSMLSTTAITINSDNVTIDLMGHSLNGPGKAAGSSGDGIKIGVSNKRAVVVKNGTVSGFRGTGINLTLGLNCQVIQVQANMSGGAGIDVGQRSRVTQCIAEENNGTGIRAAAYGAIVQCTAAKNHADGIEIQGSGQALECTSMDNQDDGIVGSGTDRIIGCTATSNDHDGIEVATGCVVENCTVVGSGPSVLDGAGIHVTGSNNIIRNNHLRVNDRGVDLDAGQNIVANNILESNPTPIDSTGDNMIEGLISTIPYVISHPGTYRPVGSLRLSTINTHGITIVADDVTMDLGGQALIGPGKASGSSGNGVHVRGQHYNVEVRNGTVRNWRLQGVDATSVDNGQFRNLRCFGNGGNGIKIGRHCLAIGNTCDSNGAVGIFASSSNATIRDNTCTANPSVGSIRDRARSFQETPARVTVAMAYPRMMAPMFPTIPAI